jgi:hypothetical protein
VSSDPAESFEKLAAMVEHELQLVSAGRFDELDAAITERSAFFATLPAPPPPEAVPAFERAHVLHQQVLAATLQARQSVVDSLVKLRQVRHATEGYRPPRRHKYSTTA